MRFTLIDRITLCEPGHRIEAIKNLSLSEEYLGDHFPLFPVMPGVFMLEALTQAAAWLIRVGDDFKHSMVVLGEARNVKYANFVSPGQQLLVTAKILSQTEHEVKVEAQGSVAGVVNVSGRLILKRYNQADTNAFYADSDEKLRRSMRAMYALLHPESLESPSDSAGGASNPAVLAG
ncbi:MAG: 3-hydroxyacyl-ACP dehydratase FabZ family protein [Pirellulales bacterium]